MIWLILNILFAGLLYVVFRLYPKYGVDNLVAVVINYFIASIFGMIIMDTEIMDVLSRPWIPIAFSMGMVFLFVFLLMAQSSQVNGISITSVANKMSLIIPVLAGIILYHETTTWMIILGIIMALFSVVLTSMKEKNISISRNGYFILALIFIGSGLVDTLIKYMQEFHLSENENATFVMVLFMSSGIFGVIWMLLTQRDRFRNINKTNIIGGIALGIPNFASIYFLIMALEESGLQSSVLYSVNNMGIVAISALFGILLFKEKISFINFIGILLALVAIALIAFGR